MNELSCPCWRTGRRRYGRNGEASERRTALFLLSFQGQTLVISGAAIEGKLLDQQQALVLWASWCWRPAIEGQAWPVLPPGQEAHQDRQVPAPQW